MDGNQLNFFYFTFVAVNTIMAPSMENVEMLPLTEGPERHQNCRNSRPRGQEARTGHEHPMS